MNNIFKEHLRSSKGIQLRNIIIEQDMCNSTDHPIRMRRTAGHIYDWYILNYVANRFTFSRIRRGGRNTAKSRTGSKIQNSLSLAAYILNEFHERNGFAILFSHHTI